MLDDTIHLLEHLYKLHGILDGI